MFLVGPPTRPEAISNSQLSFEIPPEPAERNPERDCELVRDADADLHFAAFDGTNVRAVNSRHVSECLLRQPRFLPILTHNPSEKNFDIFFHDGLELHRADDYTTDDLSTDYRLQSAGTEQRPFEKEMEHGKRRKSQTPEEAPDREADRANEGDEAQTCLLSICQVCSWVLGYTARAVF